MKTKQTKSKMKLKKVRLSPQSRCAGKCRHKWRLGYDAGYTDGYDDGREDVVKGRFSS
jgi:hypothetical protein